MKVPESPINLEKADLVSTLIFKICKNGTCTFLCSVCEEKKIHYTVSLSYASGLCATFALIFWLLGELLICLFMRSVLSLP